MVGLDLCMDLGKSFGIWRHLVIEKDGNLHGVGHWQYCSLKTMNKKRKEIGKGWNLQFKNIGDVSFVATITWKQIMHMHGHSVEQSH